MPTLPALRENHTHISLYAALQGCTSLAEYADSASALAFLRTLPGDRVTTVLGWHSGKLPFAEADLADLPPVLLVNLSLHGVCLTPAACVLLETEAPELVAHHRDPDWSERNLPELFALYARFAGLTAAKVEAFLAGLERVGFGAASDLLLTSDEAWRLIRASRWGDRVAFWTTPGLFRNLSAEAQAEVVGFKYFMDGALGTRTAALSEPFLDAPAMPPLWGDAELEAGLREAADACKAVAIHAIGDAAIEQALRMLERLSTADVTFPQVRLEHVQFIHAAQAARAKALGAVLSMQPNFTSDSVDYADRLAAHWLARNNPFRMLIDEAGFEPGVDLIFGSDGMPHGLAYAATWSLFSPYPGQRLTLEELAAGYGSAPGGPLQVEVHGREVRVVNFPLGVQGESRYTDEL